MDKDVKDKISEQHKGYEGIRYYPPTIETSTMKSQRRYGEKIEERRQYPSTSIK